MEDTKKRRKTKLSPESVKEIKQQIERKIPQRIIASKYGVSQMTISKIKNHEIWENVEPKERLIFKDVRGIKVQL